MSHRISRRSVLQTFGAGAAVVGASAFGASQAAEPAKLKGNIHHSVSRWCYGKIPLEDLCKACVEIGIESVELLQPNDWPVVKKFGLTCAMPSVPGVSIGQGFNRLENHDRFVGIFEEIIPLAAAAGLKNVICMSGNRKGISDEQGLENCVVGLKRLMATAEQHKITMVMELLNSKVDHKDYQCDHTAWGVAMCEAVGSERIKLLYDIYHMQIMEGDLIRNIRDFHQYIAHYHTGGNPGRNEIDETQEIYYPAVMRAIVETGYDGFVGQEFIPKNADALESLRQSILICDV